MLRQLIVKGDVDPNKKSCYDCYHMQSAVTWWCTNEAAVECRGTKIPDANNCNFWEPAEHIKDIPWYKRWLGSYVEVRCSEQEMEEEQK